MHSSIKVAFLKKDQRVWFIRANSGIYARHFKHGEVIAIKHLEEALKDKLGNTLPSEDEIRSALLENEKYFEFIEDNKTKRQTKTLNKSGFNLLSQIKRFANDIQAGDLIVTKNEHDGYNIGICTDSNAYIEHEAIELPSNNDEPQPSNAIKLKYKFRKKVTWGPSIPKGDLPSSVRRATRGQQTISNLSPHKEKIFHLIYPFFTDGENLYFSNKIRRSEDINALVIGKLFENVALAEGIIQSLTTQDDLNIDIIVKQLNARLFTSDDFVTCKAEFMSPGDMWCKIPLSQSHEILPQILAGILTTILLTGQAEAIQMDGIDTFEPVATVVLKANDKDPATEMFKEKFKPATAAPALEKITEKLKKNSKSLEALETQRSTKDIQDNLRLSLTRTKTENLENFNYGINVIEIRNINENN